MRQVVSTFLVLAGMLADQGPRKVEVEGLHNVVQISDRIWSGSGPEGEKSFAALRKLGVKTVISVDGAQPDLAGAKKHGLRYVHIPIGYHGVPRPQALQLAKAVKELPGPFYIHCHHGKHRGPAAAAIAQLCADPNCTVETALQVLHTAGTDPKYVGLFESVRSLRRPTALELADLPALPEAATIAALTQGMVKIDHSWDNLKLIRAAGWKTPTDHPDLVPGREARQLLEAYQQLAKLPRVAQRPGDFRLWLGEGEATARQLAESLQTERFDAKVADQAFRLAGMACTQCHARYRDVPE